MENDPRIAEETRLLLDDVVRASVVFLAFESPTIVPGPRFRLTSELCDSVTSTFVDLRVAILGGGSAAADLFLVLTMSIGVQLAERSITSGTRANSA